MAIDGTDDLIRIDATKADVTLKLPDPSTCTNRLLTFRRVDNAFGHTVTITGADAEQDPTLRTRGELLVYENEKEWHVLA